MRHPLNDNPSKEVAKNRKYSRQFYRDNKNYFREKSWRLQGIKNKDGKPFTWDDFELIIIEQFGACAVCSSLKHGGNGWHVDHDHTTGIARGILCHRCNTALGLLKDDPALVVKALDYLIRTAKLEQP